MKQGSTIFLRMALLLLGIGMLVLCIFVLPAIQREWPGEYPDAVYLTYPVLGVLGTSALFFFMALYQAWHLLSYIDRGAAFSQASVKALRRIMYCASVIGVLFTGAMPIVYYVAQQEDAPGLMVIGLVIAGASFVIATFAALLQKLLRNAIAIKSENDLTV